MKTWWGILLSLALMQAAVAGAWSASLAGLTYVQFRRPPPGGFERPPPGGFERPPPGRFERPPDRPQRHDDRLTEEERRALQRDLDQANREIYNRRPPPPPPPPPR